MSPADNNAMTTPAPTALQWHPTDLRLDLIDHSRVRHREDLLLLLAGSSFIEIASDTYALNLTQYFGDEHGVASWLVQWEQEELQHGQALRAYVEAVWPQFDWMAAYQRFYREYQPTCEASEYKATHALEMAARCVVETATSTCYRSIRDLSDEPVLRQIAEHIRCDEVRHYRQFLRYFHHFNEQERNSPAQIVGALHRRLKAAWSDDAGLALWHAFEQLHPHEPRGGRLFRQTRKRVAYLLRSHYPAEQAVRMLLALLRLPRSLSGVVRWLLRPAAVLARISMLR